MRYCNIPAHSGSVAEASTRFRTHSNGKKHRKYRIVLQSGGLQASTSLLLYAPPDCKRQGLAKPLHWLLGEQEDVTLAGGTHRRAKITQNAQQRAGLAAKSTPPVPRGSYFTHGMPRAKGRVCFCRRVAYFQKQPFFLNRTEPASFALLKSRITHRYT